MPRVLVLIATIPQRRASCERLLCELPLQSRQPDGVVLCLDGYGEEIPEPACPLPIVAVHRTMQLSGPGKRWSVTSDLRPDDILINLDDDVWTRKAPNLIKALVAGVEECGAAAAFGKTPDGKRAPPGKFSRGHLIYGGGCGLSMRVGHLDGLQELSNRVIAACGFNPLGHCGDDDALVSALLSQKGIKIKHAATGVIHSTPGTQRASQTKARLKQRRDINFQKKAIKRLVGWPWPEVKSRADQK